MTEKRKKAIIRRRIFLACVAAVLAATIAVVVLAVSLIKKAVNDNGPTGNESLMSEVETSNEVSTDSEPEAIGNGSSVTSDTSANAQSSTPSSEPANTHTPNQLAVSLDPDFTLLSVINADNPLPDDYDSRIRANLVEIDPKYRNNNNVTQIHKSVYPYITAMVAAAQSEGVKLYVWSPFRNYATQNILFQNQVNKWGGDEVKAASIVARPGTSEHNTGFCADFVTANDWFEDTPMFTWMCENAEDFGFILRYPKDKINETGVIYESWHWRFVGINAAKEINKLGVTLEKYVEMKGLEPQSDLAKTLQ